MLRTHALPGLFLILALAISVFASSSDNSPTAASQTPLTEQQESATAAPSGDSPMTATVDVVGRVGSLGVLAVALAPQSVADATAAGIHAVDIPGHIAEACAGFGGLCRSCAANTYSFVKETVHWLALPLYMFRHLLKALPTPQMPWEKR